MRHIITKAVITGLAILAPNIPGMAAQPATAEVKPIDTQLVTGANAFGFNLLRQLAAQNKDKNILVSPYSITNALGMVLNGAGGTTRQEMAQTLGWQETPPTAITESETALRQALQAPGPNVELTVANSLWARQGVRFNQNFLDVTRQSFGAEIHELNFADPHALATINGWVNANTKGKIPAIISRLNPDDLMVLLNAIYFKGQWQRPFDPKHTQDGDFQLPGNATKRVPFMFQAGRYNYWHGPNFAALNLPYGTGRLSMIVLLPDAGVALPAVLNDLDEAHWSDWLSKLASQQGKVKLPRFKMDFATTLNAPLQSLGIKSAFAGNADFSAMRPQRDVFISQVVHKAIMEVNEEGTVAAAATGITMSMGRAIDPRRPFEFTADRPFLTVIVDRQTASVLFAGIVADPQ